MALSGMLGAWTSGFKEGLFSEPQPRTSGQPGKNPRAADQHVRQRASRRVL